MEKYDKEEERTNCSFKGTQGIAPQRNKSEPLEKNPSQREGSPPTTDLTGTKSWLVPVEDLNNEGAAVFPDAGSWPYKTSWLLPALADSQWINVPGGRDRETA